MTSESTPVGRLKTALIARLIDAIENGATAVDEDGAVVKLTCPASILSVAAKVVKDFHQEAGKDPSVTELENIVKAYQDKKAGLVKTAH